MLNLKTRYHIRTEKELSQLRLDVPGLEITYLATSSPGAD